MLNTDVKDILAEYRSQAYLHTRVDSLQVVYDSIHSAVDIIFVLFEGKRSILKHLEIDGCKYCSAPELESKLQLHDGEPFIPEILEQDIREILQQYDRLGFPLANATIQDILFEDSMDVMAVSVQVHMDEEKAYTISEMRIEGNKTTKEYVITREARLRDNEPYSSTLPDRVKRRLDHLQLFSSVSMPELYLTEANQAGLFINVVEGNQNSFDGVLGYVPSNRTGESGSITGLVNISLRNLFGTGRKLSVRWFQENKYSRETELHYFEPWIASYPINAQIGFFQRKQDSTYVRMQYDMAGEFMVTEEFTLGISFSQNNIYPTIRYNGLKVIPDSKTTSFGGNVRFDSRDNPMTPTSGILYSTEYQTGTKRTFGSLNVSENSSSTTRRLLFDVSYYLSPFLRQVFASEVHGRDFSSSNVDISDVYRLGGATTLRGYEEGQFLGTRLLWANFEYRFLVPPLSFFYTFIDVGYIAPFNNAAGLQISEQTKIGYGVGVRLDSSLGLIGVSFALGQGDTFSTSKIHFRLINEF